MLLSLEWLSDSARNWYRLNQWSHVFQCSLWCQVYLSLPLLMADTSGECRSVYSQLNPELLWWRTHCQRAEWHWGRGQTELFFGEDWLFPCGDTPVTFLRLQTSESLLLYSISDPLNVWKSEEFSRQQNPITTSQSDWLSISKTWDGFQTALETRYPMVSFRDIFLQCSGLIVISTLTYGGIIRGSIGVKRVQFCLLSTQSPNCFGGYGGRGQTDSILLLSQNSGSGDTDISSLIPLIGVSPLVFVIQVSVGWEEKRIILMEMWIFLNQKTLSEWNHWMKSE